VDSRDLNQVDHYLHKNLWPQGTLIISDARRIDLPDQSFETVISISALEEMPNPELVLQEMMRLARKRVIITCDIRGSGISVSEFEKIFSRWGVKFNPPSDALTSLSLILLKYRQRPVFKNRRIRVVGLVFDRNH
jgi:ubiquinone/menaquinone biosynthesis C-methylase UbiE